MYLIMNRAFKVGVATLIAITIFIPLSACNYADNIDATAPESQMAGTSSPASTPVDDASHKAGSTPSVTANPAPSSGETAKQNSSASGNVQNPSGTESTPNVKVNPQTPDSGEIVAKNAYDYALEEEKATALEIYLRETLSPADYGGIYLWKSDVVGIDVWVVNEENVVAALDAYTGAEFEVNLKSAKCSIEDLRNLSETFNNIPLNTGESMRPIISEYYNMITCNISEIGAERLKNEIDNAVKKSHISSECVSIYVISLSRENPVT